MIRRASALFDTLTVGVLINESKKPLFSMDERVELLRESLRDLPNVNVTSFSGLNLDFAKNEGASAIVRGIRGTSDLEFEMQIANGNRAIDPSVDTVFLLADPSVSFVSSSITKEIAHYGGDISSYVTPFVENKIKEKLMEIKK